MSRKRSYCLTIAGFDPSGGAGLVADVKTFEQFRLHGLSVVTANTIQTEDSYLHTHWTPQAILIEQLAVLLERYPIQHIKIGLVENAAVLLTILETLHTHLEDPFILWDPVLKPSAGGDMEHNRFSDSLPSILSQISCITPNVPEYSELFGTADPAAVAQEHAIEIYLKGGHADVTGKDFLYSAGKVYPFNAHITTSLEKHGTGCMLSAALTACRALDYPVVKGALKSKRYVERALLSTTSLLAYHRF